MYFKANAPDDLVTAAFELANKLRMAAEQRALMERIHTLGGTGKGGSRLRCIRSTLRSPGKIKIYFSKKVMPRATTAGSSHELEVMQRDGDAPPVKGVKLELVASTGEDIGPP